jgi:hypothetical protein
MAGAAHEDQHYQTVIAFASIASAAQQAQAAAPV